MNRNLLIKAVMALIAIGCLVVPLSAQGTGGAIDAKIGFVNSLEILQGCAEGKAEIAKVDAFARSQEEELQTVSQELSTLRTNYQREVNTLNPATAAEMEASIREKDKQLRRMTEDAEARLEEMRADLFTKMGEKIRAVISQYAVDNGYDIIFLESPGLPYHAEALDLTEEIIKVYDVANPAG